MLLNHGAPRTTHCSGKCILSHLQPVAVASRCATEQTFAIVQSCRHYALCYHSVGVNNQSRSNMSECPCAITAAADGIGDHG
jgi:hypothetical protein